MDAWLDYSVSDFLLFSPETYWRLFDQVNGAVWPFQFVLLAALTGILILCVLGYPRAGLAVGASLALCWVLVGIVFFQGYYAPINWAIAYVVPFVWAQAALLVLLAPRLAYVPAGRRNALTYVAAILALTYPVFSILDGRPLAQAEVAGVAPDPTSLLTLALVGLAQPGWHRVLLSVVPTVWLMFSALTVFTLDSSSFSAWVIPGVMAVLFVSTIWPADRQISLSK